MLKYIFILVVSFIFAHLSTFFIPKELAFLIFAIPITFCVLMNYLEGHKTVFVVRHVKTNAIISIHFSRPISINKNTVISEHELTF